MRGLFVSGIAAAAFLTGPALAADMPVKAPYRAPPPVYIFSWTGCYIGGHGGGLWVQKDYTLPLPGVPGAIVDAFAVAAGVPVGTALDLGGHDADNWLGGGQVGCNYQTGNFVIGIQGDYAWTDAQGDHLDPFIGVLSFNSRTKSLASVTGRIGYAWDRVLVYVKGGGAWEKDDYDITVPALGDLVVATSDETRSGWTVGGGIEYAFTDWITGFAEYNYYDFGTRTVTFDTVIPGLFVPIDIDERKSVVKAGINFKWGAPVAAKF
jgi:outer membrane immunogenic protein